MIKTKDSTSLSVYMHRWCGASCLNLSFQLEDAEYGMQVAIKARKGVELEAQELQSQVDELTKAKHEVRSYFSNVSTDYLVMFYVTLDKSIDSNDSRKNLICQ